MARILQALIDALADLFMMTSAPPLTQRSAPNVGLEGREPNVRWDRPLERKPPLIVPPVTEVEPMGAYRCSLCGWNFQQNGKCRACGGDLSYLTNARPTPEEDLPPEIKAVLPPYEGEVRELTAEIRQAEVEAQRRGPRWSTADVLEEWGERRPAA